ncbi:PP2C family protein-serine/threonine phosphatase [Paractinoplanes atraurantiacus]|uniref:Stage II sporulation protein E (SpoIIE) n=1 Tax=Paractinoplanes atraurantiacus TaxID=1036182 RepID=A0A285H427_9ACTN|nr:PP2C family protein-serine/threonine phosphatase [Actinoplanes atraurantiacus]SNY30589.1 Stage II sporulation protein E (SpoIIE) [Actinoplanes atraurantiacus]
MIDRLQAVRRALAEAAADSVPERLAGALASSYALADTELYLVDYRLAALLPLLGDVRITHPGDPAWRSFDHQSEVITDDAVYLPVTARGERIGVLRAAPVPGDSDTRGELAEIATLVAHELQSAAVGTDRYRTAARTKRLTLAAEMQWELLPGRSRVRPSFSLAGQLEPSYAVRGDSFDWAEHDGRLFLSVLNGMGDGVQAALLTALATYALRNARRAGIGLADQAALADQAVYAQHRGGQYVSALMLEVDLATGEVLAVDAGSPQLLFLRDGVVGEHKLTAQFPLGMFEDTDYRVQAFTLRPGDRLMIVSDGVHEAVTGVALARFVRHTGSLAPLQAVRSLLGDLRTHLEDADLEDDAVAVCLDWPGPLL